jgi:hypothetical protein
MRLVEFLQRDVPETIRDESEAVRVVADSAGAEVAAAVEPLIDGFFNGHLGGHYQGST